MEEQMCVRQGRSARVMWRCVYCLKSGCGQKQQCEGVCMHSSPPADGVHGRSKKHCVWFFCRQVGYWGWEWKVMQIWGSKTRGCQTGRRDRRIILPWSLLMVGWVCVTCTWWKINLCILRWMKMYFKESFRTSSLWVKVCRLFWQSPPLQHLPQDYTTDGWQV